MTAESIRVAGVALLLGALYWVMPSLSRPTLQFGVRLPTEFSGAPVIARERGTYRRRITVLTVCAVPAALLSTADSRWLGLTIIWLQIVVAFCCYALARQQIRAVKLTESWYDDVKQAIVVDTAWRTEPEPFPWRWTAPGAVIVLATAATGVVRYPQLPDQLATHFTASGHPDHWADRSPWSAFALVIIQLFVLVLITGLMALTYHSRPDTDAADIKATTSRYRVFLRTMTRAMLVMVALVEVSLAITALQVWQFFSLTGAAAVLPVLPAAVGGLGLIGVAIWLGQAGSLLPHPSHRTPLDDEPVANRDDDTYWKAGLIYLNRDDPAIMVGKRFGIGWTLNFGNPKSWLVLGTILSAAIGLAFARGR